MTERDCGHPSELARSSLRENVHTVVHPARNITFLAVRIPCQSAKRVWNAHSLNLPWRVGRYIKHENVFVEFLLSFLVVPASENKKCGPVGTERSGNGLAQRDVASSRHPRIKQNRDRSRCRIGCNRESVGKPYRITRMNDHCNEERAENRN